MVFETISKVEKNITLTAIDSKRDGNNNLWYKTVEGWVCANYVTLDSDKHKVGKNKKNMLTLSEADSEDDGETVAIEGATRIGGETTDGIMGGIIGGGFGSGSENEEEVKSKDVFLRKRMFGVPYQFLPSTDIRDPRSTADAELGLMYNTAMVEAPVIAIVPGTPMFLPSIPADEREGMIQMIDDKMSEMKEGAKGRIIGSIDSVIDDEDRETRFFTFCEDFSNFVRYFNTLCQACSIYMNIGDEMAPGYESFTGEDKWRYQFKHFNWAMYSLANQLAGRVSNDQYIFGQSSSEEMGGSLLDLGKSTAQKIKDRIGDFSFSKDKYENFEVFADLIGDLTSMVSMEKYYTYFYIDPNVSYSETFSNQTRESMMAGIFEGASQWTKELAFLMNSNVIAKQNDSNLNAAGNQIMEQARNLLPGTTGSLMNRFLYGATTVLSGANISFPELWANSQYSKNFNINMHLRTPYGTKRNIFLDLFVPMWFWVALTAPRQSSVNGYGAPFLCRCYVPGMFSVDTGIIDNLTITRGGDGSAWSKDGLPLEMDISVSIKELYSALSISVVNSLFRDVYNFLWNSPLLDYIAVQSGVELNHTEIGMKLKIATALVKSHKMSEYVFDTAQEHLASKIYHLMGSN